MNNNFEDVVFNRHSVKEFDVNKKISREEMIQIFRRSNTCTIISESSTMEICGC